MPQREAWPGWSCSGVANLRRAAAAACSKQVRTYSRATRGRWRSPSTSASATARSRRLPTRRVPVPASCSAGRPRDVLRRDPRRRAEGAGDRAPLPGGVRELARASATRAAGPVELSLRARGAQPDHADGNRRPSRSPHAIRSRRCSAPATRACSQQRARFPERGPARCPRSATSISCRTACRKGEAFMQTAVGQEILDRSASARPLPSRSIVIDPEQPDAPTPPSVVAATNGAPLRGGGQVRVATDVPARVEIEVRGQPPLQASRTVRATPHGTVRGPRSPTCAACSRARACSGARDYAVADARRSVPRAASGSFPDPAAGAGRRSRSAPAPSQFGPIFDQIAGAQPGRVRLAGRPELPRHDRPARADGRAATRHLARLPGEPAAEPDPRARAVRRPARRPRLRRAGRELDEPRAVGARALGVP